MLYHALHCVGRFKFAIVVAIFAIFEISAAVGIGAANLLFGDGHAATLAELRQLAGLEAFLLMWKSGIVGGKFFGLFISHKVAFWWRVGGFYAAEVAGNQLLRKEK